MTDTDPLLRYYKAPYTDLDPMNPMDMLGQPIAVGDFVTWAVSIGRSVGMDVGQIVKFRFTDKNPASYGRSREVRQDRATGYTVSIRPIIGTAHRSEDSEYVPDGFFDAQGRKQHFRPTGKGVKPVSLNTYPRKLIKLDPALVERAVHTVGTVST